MFESRGRRFIPRLKAWAFSPDFCKNPKGGQAFATDGTPPFLSAKNLQPYIDRHLPSPTAPIDFRPLGKGASRALGYPAELLPAVCKIFLDARDAGVLNNMQQHIAAKCDILIRGFATVGIIALVDEATGYQYDRARNELHLILERYISKELLPWAKRFPDEFYKHMFRLRGWKYPTESAKRPGYVGKLTRRLIYEKLPPGVLEELERKNPSVGGRRRARIHQFLTEDVGNPHLDRQITAVVTLFKISKTWDEFSRHFLEAFPNEGDQTMLALDELDQDEVAASEQE